MERNYMYISTGMPTDREGQNVLPSIKGWMGIFSWNSPKLMEIYH